MALHYTTKDFFRQIPNTLLTHYFHKWEMFIDPGFFYIAKTRTVEPFGAWLCLPNYQRNAMNFLR